MGFDTFLKRYFVVVVLALIGLAAYFQASGFSQWLGSALGADSRALMSPQAAMPPGLMQAAAPENTLHTRSADAIIARNPFDSVTGPLNKPDAAVGEDGEITAVDFSNPYTSPDCDGSKVLIIAASKDPAWSMAALSGGDQPGKTQMRRIGDTFGTKRIWYISWDRVWLQGDGQLCQIKMFSPQASAPPPTAPPVASGPTPRKGPGAVPEDIASKIQRVSPTEFNIDRSVVDKILENQAELMRSARIVPEQENGKVVGIRLFGIRPETLLGTLGMENGDRLESINGFNMASPDKALEAYARLRTAPHLTVAVNRRGNPVNIDFNIK